jgi:hypothetical protein
VHKDLLILIGIFSLVLFIFAGIGTTVDSQQTQITDSQFTTTSQTSLHVQIFSVCQSGNQYLYVPVNSSGISVFPLWEIYLYGNGNFKLTVNNTVVESGVVVNNIHIKYDWTAGKGNRTTAILNFDNTNYTFDDILSGPLNDQVIQSVTVTSVLKGQNQILAAESNVSGDLMFPTWTVAFHATQRLNYSIYENGKLVESGSVIGNKNVSFNVSGSSVSVQVILGQRTYTYPNELISSVPLSRYYGPKPPTNTATFLDEVFAAVKGVFGLFPAMVLSYLGVKPLVIARKERTPVVW